MKKIILSALMLITIYGAHAQHIIEVPLSQIPTNQEVQLSDEISGIQIQLEITPTTAKDTLFPPQRPINHPPMMRGNFPKPIEIKKTGNRVIMIFDRKEWERVRYMQIKRWQRVDEVRKQREWLERRREYWNKQKNK